MPLHRPAPPLPPLQAPREVNKPFLKNIGFPLEILGNGTICEPVGCEACHGTGYSGRTGIYEILTVTDEIRQMVVGRKTSGRIKEYAVSHGMHTLRMDGWRKLLAGITSSKKSSASPPKTSPDPLPAAESIYCRFRPSHPRLKERTRGKPEFSPHFHACLFHAAG